MVFRRRVKCCNPINNTFAVTDFFENQFYANNQNDLRRSKNLDKSLACRRWALIEVNNEQGFKHAVPPEKKNGYLYITQLITRKISLAASLSACECVEEEGWEGERRDCPLLTQSNHKILKYRPFTN